MFNFLKNFSDKKEEQPESSAEQNNDAENEVQKESFWAMSLRSFKEKIANTSKNLVGDVMEFASGAEELDDLTLDDMEDLLIKADIGVDTAVSIVDKLRGKNLKSSELKDFLKREFEDILNSTGDSRLNFVENALNIYFVVGVNGAGKTTFIGKLANKFKSEGKRVLIAAGDTFRAAAEEQLDIWAQRADVDIVRKDGADAASVVFDAVKKSKDENYDVLIIDTAGRLQNKFNLMEELKKLYSVINKLAPENLRETMLVLDANTGQNGLSQAKVFSDAAELTSVVLTKLDGSAKGGIVFAIAREMHLPVKMIGVGEKITDIRNFDKKIFIDAIFE